MQMVRVYKRRGFTLIELSIVIVILGLIVAGVIGGQTLIEQSKGRKVMSDTTQFQVAFNSFLLEYGQLPGDIRNARLYWPSCGDSDAECNGNNNRRFDTHATTESETFRAWQHLNLAEILPVTYTGFATTDFQSDPGINVPEGPFANTGYSISTSIWFSGVAGEVTRPHFVFGAQTSGGVTAGPGISGVLAQSIDQKSDDGVANSGKILWDEGAGAVADSCGLASEEATCQMHFAIIVAQ